MSTDPAWGHPQRDTVMHYDLIDLNGNQLLPRGWGPPGMGANYKCFLCRIYKVEKGE